MPEALINGVRLSYQVDGEGPPLVMGHSLALDHHLYDDAVMELSRKWQVIRPDFRGHGESARPYEDYDLECMTNDLIGLVDHLGLERFAYAGLSMGGMIGMRLALALGNRINALVLMDTSAGAEPNLPDVNAFLGISLSRKFIERNPPSLERLRTQLMANDPVGNYYAQIAVLRRECIEAQLCGIESPTLVVVGEKDMPTPLPCAQKMAAEIPNAQLMVVPESGHLTILEATDIVASAIDEHLTIHVERN